jgi:hypothetical protein
MTKHQNPEMDLPQTQETAQVELLESIETLRALLYRFIPLLNSESIETRTRSTLALEKIHREIRQISSQSTPFEQPRSIRALGKRRGNGWICLRVTS